MWCGAGSMGFAAWAMMVVFWGALGVLVFGAVRAAGDRTPSTPDAVAILERRFAAGEIDRDEFEMRRSLLDDLRKARS